MKWFIALIFIMAASYSSAQEVRCPGLNCTVDKMIRDYENDYLKPRQENDKKWSEFNERMNETFENQRRRFDADAEESKYRLSREDSSKSIVSKKSNPKPIVRGEFSDLIDCYEGLRETTYVTYEDSDLLWGHTSENRQLIFPLGSLQNVKANWEKARQGDELIVTENNIDRNNLGSSMKTDPSRKLMQSRTVNMIQNIPRYLRMRNKDFPEEAKRLRKSTLDGLKICADVPALSEVAWGALAKIYPKITPPAAQPTGTAANISTER